MKIYKNVSELVGRTPLLMPQRFSEIKNLRANLFCKLEYFNPAGSSKDRVAKNMIDAAEKSGLLKSGSVIIEPTSGNTGIGLASIGASKGYDVILTMPESMSAERIKLLKAYGAKIVLTSAAEGMKGAIAKAEEIAASTENSFIPSQFENRANPEAHKLTTAAEIWDDTDGKIDIFIASVGTGGTISGIGEYLKEKNSSIEIIAVEPSDSPLLSKGYSGAHGIQGIGANFIPRVLNTDIYDNVIAVSENDAYSTARDFAHSEGLLVGMSSGAVLFAACSVAADPKNFEKNIVVLLPDNGDRYLSTSLFE